jgi:transcriptional regulator with XRE-family HTH domain
MGLGLSLRALAERCADAGASVSDSQLSKIERGMYMPYPKLRATLAQILDLDPVDLSEPKAKARS